jgi:hypothetical protein
MTTTAMKRALKRISTAGNCYRVDGRVRAKHNYADMKVRAPDWFAMVMNRYVTLAEDTMAITVTDRGRAYIREKKVDNSHARAYNKRIKSDGYVRMTFWLHQHDVEEWENFRCRLRKP